MLFHGYQQKITSVSLLIRFEIALAIGRISEPIEAYNILRLFLDVQIGYAIDMKEKSISFIKKISSKFFIMNFYRKVQKLELIKIFIFLFESQLIRINTIVIAFKFIITKVHRSSINLKYLKKFELFTNLLFLF